MAQKLSPKISSETPQQEDSFWGEHYPNLQRYCYFLAQNRWDGDDIAQETYLKAKRYGAQQQKLTPALLNKIAYHHWIDLLRKRKKETLSDRVPSEILHLPLDEMKSTVELMLQQFTPKQAVMFLLKEGFQYQIKEIAELLDTTEMAVKGHLHRAKKRLEKGVEQSSSVDYFWNEEEKEQCSELFYEALKNQDPTIVIEAVPAILSEVPNAIFGRKHHSAQTVSPSSTLCLAA